MSGLRMKILVLLGIAATIVVTIGYFVVQYTHTNTIETQTLRVADILSEQIKADRAVYTNDVVSKLKADGSGAAQDFESKLGYIMLPAQFARKVSLHVNKNQSYRYSLVSEWNINPEQAIESDFDHWAWEKLKKQQDAFKARSRRLDPVKGYPWKPSYRFETVNGESVLRYMAADPASGQSCISCHNGLEQTPQIKSYRVSQSAAIGKTWQLHELMGAFSFTIPVSDLNNENAGSQSILIYSILGLLIFVPGITGMIITFLTRSTRKPLEDAIGELGALSNQIEKVTNTVMNANGDLVQGAEQQCDTVQQLRFLKEIQSNNPQHKQALERARETLDNTEELADQNAGRAEESALACQELEGCVQKIKKTSAALLELTGGKNASSGSTQSYRGSSGSQATWKKK